MNIILMLILALLGVLLGNLLTSFYYRIPNDIPLYGKKQAPHCSSCAHKLKPTEYLPVIGWINCWGKCKKCGTEIDRNYYLIEIISMFLLPYIYVYSVNIDDFILQFLICYALLLNIFILSKFNIISIKIIIFIGFISFTLRTAQDGSIFPFLYSLLILSTILAILERYNKQKNLSNIYKTLILIFITTTINHLLIFTIALLLMFFLRTIITIFAKKQFKFELIINTTILFTILISMHFNH